MDRGQLFAFLTSADTSGPGWDRAVRALAPQAPIYIRLIGACGSGKTTIARQWEEDFHVPCLSLDRFLSANPWMASLLEMLNQEFDNQLEQALATGKTICDDNLNLNRRDRLRLAARVKARGYHVVNVFIDASLELCLAQNQKRQDCEDLWTGGVVPEAKLRQIYERLQASGRPDASEGEVYRLTPISAENRYVVEQVREINRPVDTSPWWWQYLKRLLGR